jgi:type I restriction enzyme S subunit
VGVDNLLADKRGKMLSGHVPQNGMHTRFDCDDILIGNIRPYLKKIWLSDITGGANGDVLIIKLMSDCLLPKFIYQLLSSDLFFSYNMQYAKGAKMPRGSKEAIMRYEIPIPPIEEQKRIVSILDRFEVLVNDISSGLPVEITARQKQYEYYRYKLLTFPART